MPGFSGVLGRVNDVLRSVDLAIPLSNTTENKQYSFENIWLKRFVVPKFLGDKIFDEDDEFLLCTDGVFLNATTLRARYSVTTNFALLKTLFRNKALLFPNDLRGTFAGCLYDKTTDSFHLFTDHLGTKPIFYFFDRDTKRLIFGSELKAVVTLMRHLNIPTSLSDVGAYCLLTFGFMLDNHTLVDTVKRLAPGSILSYQGGTITTKQYYRLDNTLYHTEPQTSITANLNALFSEAVTAEYDKDKEYGYRHIGTLSGGLDSRMNLLSARQLGYDDLYTVTCSQSHYLDETIARSIAGHCGFHSVFYSLDNGNYLADIDGPVLANDGLVLYSGAAHFYRMLSLLNWEHFGILHTGMLGDAVLGGTYLSCEKHTAAEPSEGSYSRTLLPRISSIATAVAQEYDNSELYLLYNRGINGIFNGYWMANQFTECASPFLHIDFLEYAIKIHPRKRFRYRIYHQWISKYLPEAARFTWELSGTKIRPDYLFWHRVRRVLEVTRRFVRGPLPDSSMNPFEYWFSTNRHLVETVNNYFTGHIEGLKGRPELYKDANVLFETGTHFEKTQVLTLLAALQLLGVN